MHPSTNNNRAFKTLMWFAVLLVVGGFSASVWLHQDSLLFHPRPYRFAEFGNQDIGRYVHLGYEFDGLEQVAFYLPPKDPIKPPDNVWIMLNGNGSLALDWHELISAYPDPSTAFFLVDYPGYGKNAGAPSKDSIYGSAQSAFDSLLRYLSIEQSELRPRLGVVGYSLGSAPALELAKNIGIERIVLLSPFSTMQRLVCKKLMAPFCYLLRHHFDNISALKDILQKSPGVRIVLMHGTADAVIPAAMSETLAEIDRTRVQLAILPGETHNSILQQQQLITQAMVNTTNSHSEMEQHDLVAHNPNNP
jgi:hypothetical protein